MRRITSIAVIVLGMLTAQVAKATNDTTKVNYSKVIFDSEVIESPKTGKVTTSVIVNVDGKWYNSNKESLERYKAIKKFGGVPCIVLISNDRNRKGRIVVL